MVWRPPQSLERLIVRKPRLTTGTVITVGLLTCLIPYVGPLLGVLVVGGGLGGSALVRQRARRALEQQPSPAALPSPPRYPQTMLQEPQYEQRRAQPPHPVAMPTRVTHQQPAFSAPDVGELAATLAIDGRQLALDEQVEVAGETYRTRQIRAVYRACGVTITSKGATIQDLQCLLVPEPWNDFDQNAVAVVIGTQHVGYLPAELATDYAAPLRSLAQHGLLISGQARVWAKSDSGMVRARVTILVPATEDL